MKYLYTYVFLISFQFSYASIVHKAMPYIPKNEAAGHSTRVTYRKNLIDYATSYMDYLKTGHGDPKLFNLITNQSLQHGFKPFNLLPSDVQQIKDFFESNYLSKNPTIDSPLSSLPEYIMQNYINISYELADHWEEYVRDDSNVLGDEKNIRHGLADFMHTTLNLKYTYVHKDEEKQKDIEIKKTVTNFIDFFNKYEFFEYAQNHKDLDLGIEGIIISESYLTGLNRIESFFKKNLQLKLVVVFDDNNTMIRNNFKINDFVECLVMCGSQVTTIGNYFLSDCSGLQKIDLSALSQVTTIDNGFLSNCNRLQKIDLSALSQVTTIRNSFLSDCSVLQEIDLSAFSQVTTIGNGFLSGCSGLQKIDLSALSQVTTIGNYFLSGCSGLQKIDLSALSQVTTIDNGFLSNCNRLQKIDLSALSQVTTIGNYFLSDCSGLQKIDLSAFSQVTTIDNGFLSNCNRLQKIDLSALSQVTTIGDYFLSDCSGLQELKIDKNQSLIISKLNEKLKDIMKIIN